MRLTRVPRSPALDELVCGHLCASVAGTLQRGRDGDLAEGRLQLVQGQLRRRHAHALDAQAARQIQQSLSFWASMDTAVLQMQNNSSQLSIYVTEELSRSKILFAPVVVEGCTWRDGQVIANEEGGGLGQEAPHQGRGGRLSVERLQTLCHHHVNRGQTFLLQAFHSRNTGSCNIDVAKLVTDVIPALGGPGLCQGRVRRCVPCPAPAATRPRWSSPVDKRGEGRRRPNV